MSVHKAKYFSIDIISIFEKHENKSLVRCFEVRKQDPCTVNNTKKLAKFIASQGAVIPFFTVSVQLILFVTKILPLMTTEAFF